VAFTSIKHLFASRRQQPLSGDRTPPPVDPPTKVSRLTWHLEPTQFAEITRHYDTTVESLYVTSEALVQFAAYLAVLEEQKDAKPFTREVLPHYKMLEDMIDDVNDMIGILRSLYEEVAEKHRGEVESEGGGGGEVAP
jgi:hypothetical protein